MNARTDRLIDVIPLRRGHFGFRPGYQRMTAAEYCCGRFAHRETLRVRPDQFAFANADRGAGARLPASHLQITAFE